MTKVGIVGYGVVGKATHFAFLQHLDPVIYDLGLPSSSTLSEVKQCDYVFLCIPSNNTSDLETIRQYIDTFKVTILRSTVPVGFCSSLSSKKLIYMPEFLREKNWIQDCVKTPIILGSNCELPSFLTSEILQVSFEEAEILKLMSNAFNSLRVVFANHLYDLASQVNADYDVILKAYEQVKHNKTYLECNDNLRGFGGKCLPKDLDFLISCFREHQLNETLLSSVKQDNNKWKTTIS